MPDIEPTREPERKSYLVTFLRPMLVSLEAANFETACAYARRYVARQSYPGTDYPATLISVQDNPEG